MQLAELHARAKLHADRLWQLPFAFLGIVAISASLIEKEANTELLFWLFVLYAALGVCALLAMLGALEGVMRALRHMMRVEVALGLESTTKLRPVFQFLPYFAMQVLGVVFCTACAAYYW